MWEGFVDFGVQVGDVNIDDICLGVEMIILDFFQQYGLGYDLVGMFYEKFQQVEFVWLQQDFFFVLVYCVGKQVYFQIVDYQFGVNCFWVMVVGQGFNVSQQFGEGVRFDEIVIFVGFEVFYVVIDFVQGGEDQNRCMIIVLVQGFDYGQVVYVWYYLVNDKYVVFGCLGYFQIFFVVNGMVCYMVGFVYVFVDVVCCFVVIFYDKNMYVLFFYFCIYLFLS